MNFLELLRDDIRAGLRQTAAGYRDKHTRWLRSQQQPDGGFANRRGRSDVYYTAFALRALSALDALTAETAAAASRFLLVQARQEKPALLRQPGGAFCDAVAAASWWEAFGLCEEIAGKLFTGEEAAGARAVTLERLGALRRADGGWAKTDIEAHGSVYHSFLASALYARLDEPVPDAAALGAFLLGMERPAGGFLENRFSRTAGTNGTAAGIFLSLLLLDGPGAGAATNLEQHLASLARMQAADGGFRAMAAAPLADLLSTCSALVALKAGGALEPEMAERARDFARGLEHSGGGYLGFALETAPDCEYTFYGLGVESLAAQAAGQ